MKITKMKENQNNNNNLILFITKQKPPMKLQIAISPVLVGQKSGDQIQGFDVSYPMDSIWLFF